MDANTVYEIHMFNICRIISIKMFEYGAKTV